jgi:pimeloyl-ACP methyl ester carboxylesterase
MATLTIGSIHLHYEIYGSGEPLFLNHGASRDCQSWNPHLNWLKEKYKVIIHDARGHGLSSAPRGEEQNSWEKLADDLKQLMEHLDIKRAIIGGVSMGGGVSHTFALKYPQKVKGLILSDSVGTGITKPGKQISQEDMERLRIKREYVIHRYGVVEWAYRSIDAGMAQKSIIEQPDKQLEYLQRMAVFPVNGAIYSYRLIMGRKIPGIELTKNLTMPTLIVIGDEDDFLSGAEWLRDTIPNRRFALLTYAGHATIHTKPDAWRKATEEFLDDLTAGKPIQKDCIY